jgi:hypothetical protein
MMNLVGIGMDFVAISILVFVLYFPRHRRRDMVVAYLAINFGLIAVTSALVAEETTIGIGFGLFAVLSLLRLRSAELDQQEIAYYLAAMTLGLIGALPLSPIWINLLLMALILVGLAIGDHPRLFGRYRVQVITLDEAISSEALLRARLEELLGATVHQIRVRRTDLIEDSTVVEVRYEQRTRTGMEHGA